MFPNVRLQIVALFVSVMALSFGFGVFAAFRVNHEPFEQMPAGAVPLRLAMQNTAPFNDTKAWGAPFGSRFWLSERQIHGAADLPALTPVVREEVTERTVTWVIVTGSAAAPHAPPALQDVPAVEASPDPKQGAMQPTALHGVQPVEAPPDPKQDAMQPTAAPGEDAGPAAVPAAVVGTAEPATQDQPEQTSTAREQPALKQPALKPALNLKAPGNIPVYAPRKAAGTAPRRHVAVRAPVGPPTSLESVGQRQEPVVFQTAPPPYRPQNGAPVVARSGSQNSPSEVPVFQTAPSSQR